MWNTRKSDVTIITFPKEHISLEISEGIDTIKLQILT